MPAVPKPTKRNKVKKKKTKKSATYYKAKLDKMVGAIVRNRGRCENDNCKAGSPLQWAHIISRRYLQVRWRQDNAFCLCASCHFYYTHHPIEWDMFVVEKITEEKYAELKRQALAYGKIDYPKLYEEVKAVYEQEVEGKTNKELTNY